MSFSNSSCLMKIGEREAFLYDFLAHDGAPECRARALKSARVPFSITNSKLIIFISNLLAYKLKLPHSLYSINFVVNISRF